MADNKVQFLASLIERGLDRYRICLQGQGVAKCWELTRWMEEGGLLDNTSAECIAAATTYLACQNSHLKKPPSLQKVTKFFTVDDAAVRIVAKHINSYYEKFGRYSVIIYRQRKQKRKFWYFSYPRVGVKTQEMLIQEIRLRMCLTKDVTEYEVAQKDSNDWRPLAGMVFTTTSLYCLDKRRPKRYNKESDNI